VIIQTNITSAQTQIPMVYFENVNMSENGQNVEIQEHPRG
jgi:hypothetical protein